MLDELPEKSVVVGGQVDVQDHYVAPTVLRGTYSYHSNENQCTLAVCFCDQKTAHVLSILCLFHANLLLFF